MKDKKLFSIIIMLFAAALAAGCGAGTAFDITEEANTITTDVYCAGRTNIGGDTACYWKNA